jgi:hypothetical protein
MLPPNKEAGKMKGKEKFRMAEDAEEIMELQERICQKVCRISCVALLEKLDDFVSRIYRRGSH